MRQLKVDSVYLPWTLCLLLQLLLLLPISPSASCSVIPEGAEEDKGGKKAIVLRESWKEKIKTSKIAT